ncbi:type II and III secretion system protein [Idiomarina xiamenensis]|uniref:Flp pilus assembly protein CpaC n=1 Tax=Idiomarina xiamenensis 10-D-4 TaxID=740709 RepID=K2K861_9GAMM|nr:type II and III secretion system protein [Idiomarina xiamenensis]EKE82762.1 Flp pilus assembly protein CpaC [Idiomarina xiamenensis 10-D-4]
MQNDSCHVRYGGLMTRLQTWIPVWLALMLLADTVAAEPMSSGRSDNDQYSQPIATISVVEHQLTVGDVAVWSMSAAELIVADQETLLIHPIGAAQVALLPQQSGVVEVLQVNSQGQVSTRHIVHVQAQLKPRLLLQLQHLKQQQPQLSWRQHQGFWLLTGELTAKAKAQLAELVSDYPDVLDQTQQQVTAAEMITIQVQVYEMARQQLQQLGVDWQQPVLGPALMESGLLQWRPALMSQLQALQQSGQARLLAQPQLLSKDGASADFLAGGELPIPQVSSEGLQSVTFRRYGVQLSISPKLTAAGTIHARVRAQVSNIDPATTVAGIPGLLSREATTEFDTQSGSTLVLSGLLNQQKSESLKRIPGLADVPIIGHFFSQQQTRTEQRELVILVTPQRLQERQQQLARVTQAQRHRRQIEAAMGCNGLREVNVDAESHSVLSD